MTTKDYNKYVKYNGTLEDMCGKNLHIGDTIIFNISWRSKPNIGVIKHFTENSNIAIELWVQYGKFTPRKEVAYRDPERVIKVENIPDDFINLR